MKRTWQLIVPMLIGMGVIVWLFHGEFSGADLRQVRFTPRAILFISLAWAAMGGRDFGLTWRFRQISGRHLSWKAALKVNMLCEFTSAVTPTAVGGSSMGVVYMHREGIPWGRSTTLMLCTLFLDELFFVMACPCLFLLLGQEQLFGFDSGAEAFSMGMKVAFWVVYAALTLWTAILFTGIFIRPTAVVRLLRWFFSLPLLRRWSGRIDNLGRDIVEAGKELRSRPSGWWLRVFGATALSWTSRFLVINMLFLAFVPDAPQAVIFGRQLIVWVVLMISPTPGGSGISEWIFKNYYGDFIPEGGAMVLVMTIFWRLISYYVYLVIGAIIVPRWISDGRRSARHRP